MNFDRFAKDYSHEPVPENQLRGLLSLLAVFIAFGVNIASLVFGASIAHQNSFGVVVLGAVLGGVLLAVISICTAVIGAKTRLSTAMISKFAFGRAGSNLVALIFAASLFGWFGVQTELFAASLDSALQSLFEIQVPRLVLVIGGGMLMSSTAIIGYKALEKLSFLSVPLLLLILVWPVAALSLNGAFPDLSAHQPDGAVLSLGSIIALTAGGWMAGAVIMPDITRYARHRRDAAITVGFGFAFFYPVMVVLAAILGIASGDSDFIAIMMTMGLGLPALAILILATWTTNDSNLYAASLSLAAIFQKIPKWRLAVLAGVLGTALAAFGMMAHFIPWLLVLGVVIGPIGGVMIGDYFCRPDSYAYEKLDQLPAYRKRNILAWFVGCGVGFMTATTDVKGFGLFSLTQIPPLDGLIATLLLVVMLRKLSGTAHE